MSETYLTKISEAEKMLANITSIPDARKWLHISEGLVDATIKEYKAADIKGTKDDRDAAYRNAVKAGELRLQVEARLGELIQQEQEAGRLADKGRPNKCRTGATFLRDLGLTRDDSRRAQMVAEHKDLIPMVIAKAMEVADIPTRRDLEILLRLEENKAVEQQKVQKAMPPGQYSVLLVDPPWEPDFSPSSSRRVQRHYPTLTLDELKRIKIPSASDAMLFLWTPPPMLRQALELMEAWSFEYRTCAVWDKEVIGTGYYFRSQHEILLVGKRGKLDAPHPSNRSSSVIRARRTKHSRKPEVVYEIIEKMYPAEKYIELFARNERKGWASWGNEPVTV
jgi:N6-adenosine-specific RNA methylase IME4